MERLKEEYFEQLLNIKDDLERYVVFLTRNRETAKDVLSDSIILGYQSFAKLKKKRSFKSYMFTICLRTYYKAVKTKSIVNDCEIDEFYSDTELRQDDLTDISILFDKIEHLKEKEKNVLILTELMGYKIKETAELMNLSVANVKVILHRTKNKLRKMLEVNNG